MSVASLTRAIALAFIIPGDPTLLPQMIVADAFYQP